VDRDVVDLLLALGLAPPSGQQVPVATGGRLPKSVGVRDLEIQALDPDFLVIAHGAPG
jgi:hypothetical protein